jgi:Mg-chelatase subunit ChlD
MKSRSSIAKTTFTWTAGALVAFAAACSAGPRAGFFGGGAGDAGATNNADDNSPGNPDTTLRGADAAGGTGLVHPPPVDIDAGCARGTSTARRAPLYMLIVLDGSSSMNDDGKWDAVVPALDAIFDDLATRADPGIGVGLIGFSDNRDPTCTHDRKGWSCAGPYPAKPDVPIAVVDGPQHDRLRGRIDGANPRGNTPTLTALTGAFQTLESFMPTAPLADGGKKVVVMMTDGVPSNGPSEQAFAVGAAQMERGLASPKGPIFTFAVGIGPFPSTDPGDYDPTFMGALAVAGGTAPTGCDPVSKDVTKICHFQVTPQGQMPATLEQAFVDAVNRIREEAASCDFTLDRASGAALDPTAVNVVFTDGAGKDHTIPQDAMNGWTYDNPTSPTRVTLHGSSCSEVTGDLLAKVQIVVGCQTITMGTK